MHNYQQRINRELRLIRKERTILCIVTCSREDKNLTQAYKILARHHPVLLIHPQEAKKQRKNPKMRALKRLLTHRRSHPFARSSVFTLEDPVEYILFNSSNPRGIVDRQSQIKRALLAIQRYREQRGVNTRAKIWVPDEGILDEAQIKAALQMLPTLEKIVYAGDEHFMRISRQTKIQWIGGSNSP